MTFYNDNEPYVCRWLTNLMAAGEISEGVVDGRGIESLSADDLSAYGRVHLFAGIGGWDYALKLAGWPADRPVWTGSCPCQPFSVAGKRGGTNDKRHLWPEMRRLIGECRPATVFGEQVASKAGREWLSGVFVDLEGMGYAVAGADLCAAGHGAAHIRQRLYWVAHSDKEGFIHSSSWETGTERYRGGAVDMASGASYGVSEGEPTWFKDGSTRRTQSGVAVLVDAIPGRLESCAAYGNSIVPQVAALFIRSFLEAESALNSSHD